MRLIVILAVLLMSVLSACSGAEPTATTESTEISPTPTEIVEVDTERIERGIAIFKENYCGVCHTLTIANTRGEFAPKLDSVVEDAIQQYQSDAYAGEATTVEAYLYESITTPDVYIIPDYMMSPHPMPSFRHLSDEDIQNIIYMLMNQNTGS